MFKSYLIDARPVLVGLLQEPNEGLLLPLPDDGARDGDVAAAAHDGDEVDVTELNSEKELKDGHVDVVGYGVLSNITCMLYLVFQSAPQLKLLLLDVGEKTRVGRLGTFVTHPLFKSVVFFTESPPILKS